MSAAARFGGTGLEAILALSDWIAYQLGNWEEWAREKDGGWLGISTGNPAFPTLGYFFRHAFSPLHRYCDQIDGVEPVDDGGIDPADWSALTAWAWRCTGRHRDCLLGLGPAWLDRPLRFKTRSAGELEVTLGGALMHAATHCTWHLGGMSHLLRSHGIAPPARSDLILWLASPVAGQSG